MTNKTNLQNANHNITQNFTVFIIEKENRLHLTTLSLIVEGDIHCFALIFWDSSGNTLYKRGDF